MYTSTIIFKEGIVLSEINSIYKEIAVCRIAIKKSRDYGLNEILNMMLDRFIDLQGEVSCLESELKFLNWEKGAAYMKNNC